MKNSLACLCAAVLLCPASAAMAQAAGFQALFSGGAASVTFYACEQGDSFESACSSLYKTSYLVFKKNGKATVCYGEGEKQGTWTVHKGAVRLSDPTGSTDFSLSEGKYLHYDDEETGDLIVYKLSK